VTRIVRDFAASDVTWADALLRADMGGRHQARLGELVDALAFPGLVAEEGAERLGLVTFSVGSIVEIVYIQAVTKQCGVGTLLMDMVEQRTQPRLLWLVTTNDNLDTLRFYQRRGYRIREVHVGAVDDARRQLKRSIPEIGQYGIAIHDEIVLERQSDHS
jgi:ribosomal protein S18 acetylase RimI-like enzyme